MSRNIRSARRIAAILAIAAAVPASAVAAPARPTKPLPTGGGAALKGPASGDTVAYASAVSSASVDYLSARGTCNYSTHKNSFGASVTLSGSRFPNGGWASARYAYNRGDGTGWHFTGWLAKSFIQNRVPNSDPDVVIRAPVSLTNVSFPVYSGRFVGGVQLAVWNGYNWESTFTVGDTYRSIGRYGAGETGWCWVTA
jgi:hypothetical protein